jgi:drug/metabolite transporter (DMT)-like permease
MISRRDLLVFLTLFVTFVIWSNSFIAIGMLKTKMTAFQLVQLRFIPVGLASVIIIAFGYRRQALDMLRTHPWHLLAIGALTVPSYNLLLNSAMGYLKPSAGSLLVCLNPLFTMFLARRYLGEAYTLRRAAGTVLSFLGLGVVVIYGKVGLEESVIIPLDKIPDALMVVAASFSWVVSVIISKRLMATYSAVAITYVGLAVGSLPLILLVDRPLVDLFIHLDAVDHFAWIFLSLGCTIVGFVLWSIGVKYWRASNAALFVYLNPPLTIFFAWLFLGQGISGWFLLGGAVMLAGILLATTQLGRRMHHRGTESTEKSI